MYNSLSKHCSDFHLVCLCLSEVTRGVLSDYKWDNVTLLIPEQIEDASLKAAKNNRTYHEYCWTLKAACLFYTMCTRKDAEYYAHLDSDLYFFSDPTEIFKENPIAAIYLTEHYNSKRFEPYYSLTGRYNTGFLGCRQDMTALKAVYWWRTKCIEFCGVSIKKEKRCFGDQVHAEGIKKEFPNVHVVKNIGVNAALWNIEKYKVSEKNGQIYINNRKLIFYHFSGLSVFNEKEYNLCHYYHFENENIVDLIYVPYVEVLSRNIRDLALNHSELEIAFAKKETTPNHHYYVISEQIKN